MKLRDFLQTVYDFTHPKTSLLQAHNDYLKAQLAYHQRRADVLEAKLLSLMNSAPVVKTERRTPAPLPKVVTSWESYKMAHKGETNDGSEEAAQGHEAIADAAGTTGA